MTSKHKYSRPVRLAAAITLVLAMTLSTASCDNPFDFPYSGSVQTLTLDEQRTQYVYTDPEGPEDGALPLDIVEGFFDAMPAGVQNDGYRTAREFLTSSSSKTWDGDDSAMVYSGMPEFTQQSDVLYEGTTDESRTRVTIEVNVQLIGKLDAHGVYTPVESTMQTLTFTVYRVSGQWRIGQLPSGVIVSETDFEQVYRQVTLYHLPASGSLMVPELRWLAWRNWRLRAVRELLLGDPGWLDGVVANERVDSVSALSVTMDDDVAHVRMSASFDDLNESRRALLVYRIRLALGGDEDSDLVVVSDTGEDYSQADADVNLNATLSSEAVYTLSSGHIVSLGSHSVLRVGEVDRADDLTGFAFSSNGGAALRSDGTVECLVPNGSSCGSMFVGTSIAQVNSGLDDEIWGLSADRKTWYVSRNGSVSELDIPWMKDGTVRAAAFSPEGMRVAMSVESADFNGVVMCGIIRDFGGTATGLTGDCSVLSYTNGVTMLTFHDGITMVYATSAQSEDGQRAWYQSVNGPEESFMLPESVVSMSAGSVSFYRRLAVLDERGMVRTTTTLTDPNWSMSDSQVSLISNH